MSDFSHCPYCGAYLNYSDNSSCQSCNRIIPTASANTDALHRISSAIDTQADLTANVLTALFSAHSLPLVSLLESWWGKLNETGKNEFAKALMRRCLQLIQDGAIDQQLKFLVDQLAEDQERIKALGDQIPGNWEKPLTDAVGRLVQSEIERNGAHRGVADGMKEAIVNIAREQMMGRREVIESAVRDRMPDIEEMTKKIVEEVADETAREVRSRMRRDS
jgi:uroporphyrinogen-III decarboxylase